MSPVDGRRDAFERYVLPETDVLLRVALSLTRRAADAEDLVQDTLIRAYRSIGSFDGAHPRAWLLTIMRNTNINNHRRRRPELLRDPEVTMATLAAVPSDGQADPEGVVVGEMFDAVVADAFDRLPERHRDVVRLVDIDGLTYAETAEVLGIPTGTVMSRLHRARARMRVRLTAAGLAPRRGAGGATERKRG
ncbi:MAG: sigma-70 family RNA polymerase sigma factor [Acidimicrobiia bacterium]